MTALHEKKMTFQEFREMELPDDDNFIYELLNGSLVKRASPTIRHQDIQGELFALMRTYVSEKKLGKVLSAPIDVYFDDHNCPQPDIVFVSKERRFLVEDSDYVNGAPDLIVEIISPGTGKNDRGWKKDLYERFAVKEYWIVDPSAKLVEIYGMRENAYRLLAIQEEEGVVASSVLPGFELDIKVLFDL
jgi:Uma2 family endonuclease